MESLRHSVSRRLRQNLINKPCLHSLTNQTTPDHYLHCFHRIFPMSLETMRKTLEEFKLCVAKEDSSADKLLDNLKLALLELDSLPPLCMESPSAEQERKFAMEVFEHAVLMTINNLDRDSFQRYIACLRPYYTNYSRENQTAVTHIVLGLNLLYLLVENRLADFHCELELLSDAEKALPTVMFCTQLDKHLVMGSYDQVMVAAANPPTKYFNFFLTSLLETVRINIGECAAAAYAHLSIVAATKLLMFERDEETIDFIASFYPAWEVDMRRSEVRTGGGGSGRAGRAEELPSLKLITQNLSYATELERIV